MSQRLTPRLKSEEDRDSLERNDLSPTPQERGLKMRRTRCREPRRERERGGLEEDRSDPASTLSIRVEEERGGEIACEANGPARKLRPEKSLPPPKVHDELRPLRDIRRLMSDMVVQRQQTVPMAFAVDGRGRELQAAGQRLGRRRSQGHPIKSDSDVLKPDSLLRRVDGEMGFPDRLGTGHQTDRHSQDCHDVRWFGGLVRIETKTQERDNLQKMSPNRLGVCRADDTEEVVDIPKERKEEDAAEDRRDGSSETVPCVDRRDGSERHRKLSSDAPDL